MFTYPTERRLLQIVITVLALVPIAAGLAGVINGPDLIAPRNSYPIDVDSHARYLSGLLLAIGLAFWSAVGTIEMQSDRIQLLALIVVIGGIGRLYGLVTVGQPSAVMAAALVMELLVTPAIALWHRRLVRRCIKAH